MIVLLLTLVVGVACIVACEVFRDHQHHHEVEALERIVSEQNELIRQLSVSRIRRVRLYPTTQPDNREGINQPCGTLQ